jgi:hypothetical protein
MHIFDVLEAWLTSMVVSLASADVAARFDRSPTDRPNPSCSLNLRRDDHELDLVIWESGEAELTIGEVDGQLNQMHLADIRSRAGLAELLSHLVEFIDMGQLKARTPRR